MAPLQKPLGSAAVRVLGALVEKEITTPEYYPLSLNALVNACNQKNNREPVMSLDEDDVRLALRELEEQRLAEPARDGGRVAKYAHRMQEVLNLTRAETALLCVLLLRGAQTPGELRGRCERMYAFEELADAQAALHKLMANEPPLAKALPRQHGMKEVRYLQLLGGDTVAPQLFPQSVPEPEEWFSPPQTTRTQAEAGSERDAHAQRPTHAHLEGPVAPILTEADLDLQERVTQLEAEVAVMARELAEVRAQMAQLQTARLNKK